MKKYFNNSALIKVGIISLVLVCISVIISFNGCQRKATITSVRIGTMGDAVDYAPYMVAKSQGWFEEEFKKYGVQKVEYTSFQVLAALNEALATKEVDIVFEAEPPAIIGKQ